MRPIWIMAVLFLCGIVGCSSPNPSAAPAKANGRPTGFREVAAASGIGFTMRFLPNEQGEVYKVNLYDHGCGLAVGDINGDGHDDIYFLNQMGRNALYKNKGDGTFVEVTEEAGVGLGDRICVGAAFDDYDNDGDQDLFVTSVRGGNVLFQNQGDGVFRDVTARAGVAHVGHSQAVVFFDYNRDGLLDLFVTNTAGWTTSEYHADSKYFTGRNGLAEMAQSQIEHNLLYKNNGNGTFTDVTTGTGLDGKGWGADATAFDYDEDGWMDLFVTNMFGRSQLYRNTGQGKFLDVTEKTLGKTSWGGMGAKAFDANSDGRLDLFLTDMHSDMWMSVEFPANAVEEQKKYSSARGKMAGPSAPGNSRSRDAGFVFGNTLFQNEGKGRFTEVSDRAGMETFWPWGVAEGDFDNDGHVDAFIPSGMGYPFFYWRNYLMMNNGNGAFTDRSRTEGIDPPPGGIYQEKRINGREAARSARAAAVADFDGDGRLDLITNNFNDHPYYFRNLFKAGNHIQFALTGTRSNRDAIGAMVHLYAGSKHLVRQVTSAGGYLSGGSKVVHFGLGDQTTVDRVEIRWPSGVRQTLKSPKINTLHKVTESKQ
jgi:enediyne biosynthesis protein E4